MQSKRTYILLLYLCCIASLIQAQQDPQYSQYMFNQLSVNPAYAGSRDVFTATLLYRNQWTGINGSPKTAVLSAQMPTKKRKVGLGLEFISDKLGPQDISCVLFSYSYRIRLRKGKLALGLRAGLYNYVFDWGKMDYKDQSDVNNTKNRTSKIAGTFDFGMHYYTQTFYWGISFTHLNRGVIIPGRDTIGAVRQAGHFFMPVSKAFQVGNVVINPLLIIRSAANAPANLDVGVNVLLKEKLWLGIAARSKYGVVFLTQYLINEKFKIGYSFDIGKNRIGVAGGGTHEIAITYDINLQGVKVFMPRYL